MGSESPLNSTQAHLSSRAWMNSDPCRKPALSILPLGVEMVIFRHISPFFSCYQSFPLSLPSEKPVYLICVKKSSDIWCKKERELKLEKHWNRFSLGDKIETTSCLFKTPGFTILAPGINIVLLCFKAHNKIYRHQLKPLRTTVKNCAPNDKENF